MNLIEEYIKKVNYPNHPKADRNKRFVYLFHNELSKQTKIGITDNFHKRYDDLQNASGMNLIQIIIIQLETEIDESANFIENFLHNYFHDKRTIGEWFDLSKKDILDIQKLFNEIDGVYIWDAVDDFIDDLFQT